MGKDLNGKELGVGFNQRKDGYYSYRFTNRFKKRNMIYDKSLTSLRRRAKEEAALDALNLNNPRFSKKTINELFDDSMNIFRVGELKETTIDSYKKVYNLHVRDTIVGNSPINIINPLDIKKLFNQLAAKCSQSVCGSIRACFLSIYDLAVLEGIVSYNFIHSLKIKSHIEEKRVAPLTLEQQRLFAEYYKDSFYANIFALILNTGLRVGELSGITLEDIDLDNRILHINKQLYYRRSSGTYENGLKFKFDKPKRGSIRDVPLNEAAIEALNDQLLLRKYLKMNLMQKNNKNFKELKGFENLLFLTRSGTPMYQSQINSEIYRITKLIENNEKVNMGKFSVHVLRHTFATRCIENGMNPNTLKHIMGHKRIQVTMDTYVNVTIKNTETELLDGLFNEPKLPLHLN